MAKNIKKKPIAGSLYFALIATLFAPIISLNLFRFSILPFSFDERWQIISNKLLESYNPEWVKLIYFEFISNIFLLIFTLVLIVLFIQKRRYYATVIIIYFICKILLLTIIFYLQTIIKGPPTPTLTQISGIGLRSLVFTGIWVPYFLLSARVRETFIY